MRDPKRSIYGKKGLRLEGITHGSRYFRVKCTIVPIWM